MSVQIKTLDDYGFLLSFLGGIIAVITGLLMLIISAAGEKIHWFLGAGYIGITEETAGLIAGSIISLLIGVFALLIGLKLFTQKAYDIVTRFDLIATSIVLIVIGIIAFGIGGILILIGGILVLVYRLMPEGNANPTGK